MPRKRKLLNISERCRLCLTENGEMRDLFTEPYCLKIKDLSDCTSIEIKCEQNLPKNICHACVYKLEMWNEFKERFIRSNRLLLTRLEVPDSADQSALLSKRKFPDTQPSSDENNSQENKKQHKSTKSPLQVSEKLFKQENTKDTETNNLETAFSFDTSTNIDRDVENYVSSSSKMENSPKYRQSARRGRTTERRKACTRRWDARKRALIAATGSNTETDSGASDNQLSPVQKARAKSNADKEDEKHKLRIARALKNLETNLNQYKRGGSDSDAKRRLRTRKSIAEQTPVQSKKPAAKRKDNKEKSTVTKKNDKEIEAEKENISTRPRTVKSELKIGDTTYIVTSTLVTEPAISDENLPDNIDPEKHENTDIIDAVQLKRINPLFNANSDKNNLEKCLHIEIEGTEYEALKRVQVDLASFIEKDMKEKFFLDEEMAKDLKKKFKGSYENLDQQLKTIVVKAIKKNYETSVKKENVEIEEDNGKIKSFSLEFVKAAMQSAIFQPKLIITRLDLSKVPYKINNLHILQKKVEPVKIAPKKRIRFSTTERNIVTGDEKRPDVEDLKRENPKKLKKQHVESVECDTTTNQELLDADVNTMQTSPPNKSLENVRNKNSLGSFQKNAVKHRCGICRQTFSDKKEVEEHMKYHREPLNKIREKLMRCKRCHEIVAARFVKSHICSQVFKCKHCGMSCNSEKAYLNHVKSHTDSQIYTNIRVHKCTVCDKQFTTEMQLVNHLSIHDESKSIIKCHICNINLISQQALVSHLQTHDKQDSKKSSTMRNNKSLLKKPHETNEIVSPFERRVMTTTKIDKKPPIDVPKPNAFNKHEGYTCFVCDKKFSDEEVMKDHLQQHCDDMSEDEQSSKEHFQCAICSESLESEDALGVHVENHLFDDGDDNPNLISISENGKPKEIIYRCDQCPEEFSSKAILAMHKEAHEEEEEEEEEESNAEEWDRQRNLMHEYSCTICDEDFLNENDLAEHLDTHNESAHVCLLCEKSFPTLLDLQTHVESH